MTQFSQDDIQWIHETIERYEKRLTLYTTKILGDYERAQDVVQDTFLKLCNADATQVKQHLAAWLYTVCRNGALDVLRERKKHHQMDDRLTSWKAGNEPSPAAQAEDRESTSNMITLLADLPNHQQEMITLRFQHDLTYREIAKVTDRSVSTVGYLIHEGLNTLKQWMEDGQKPSQQARAGIGWYTTSTPNADTTNETPPTNATTPHRNKP